MTEPIDLTMVAYRRPRFTELAVTTLAERTRTPYRLTLVVNGWDELEEADQSLYLNWVKEGLVEHLVVLKHNYGIHAAKNAFLPLVRSQYFVDFDNDILVPELEPDWLAQLVELFERHPRYGAISLRPQVLVGTDLDFSQEIADFHWCGASGRIMRTEVVKAVGGWEKVWNAKRNHEERYICGKMKEEGNYKFGYASNIRCYHLFGTDDNWGYGDLPPEEHGHRAVWPPTSFYENYNALDPKTFEPK